MADTIPSLDSALQAADVLVEQVTAWYASLATLEQRAACLRLKVAVANGQIGAIEAALLIGLCRRNVVSLVVIASPDVAI